MSVSIDPKNCKVALLAGGKSGEREISLASGKGAQQALEAAGFQVTMLDPSLKQDLKEIIDGDYDVAFICLHGKWGEDGTMQGFLEIAGVPYVGSNVWASAVAMDKSKAKVFYNLAGIHTPQSVVLTKDSIEKSAHAAEHDGKFCPSQSVALSADMLSTKKIVCTVGLPCVVKPATEGSALGVFIVNNEEELACAMESAFAIDSAILVERFVEGTELTVAVIGNKNPKALPIIEIVPRNEFYDFDAKYAPGGSQHLCPAPLDAKTTKHVQSMAIQAHEILGCEGMSRSDFILDKSGQAWILETNTIPGMTETSLLPDAGRAANMDFSMLCTKLIEYALEKKA